MSRPVRGAVHDAAVPFVKRVAERTRSKHLFAIDIIGTTVAAVVALVLWLDAAPGAEFGVASPTIVGIIVATRMLAALSLGLYARSWRHASMNDMGRIVTCAAAGSIGAYGIVAVAETLGSHGATPIPGAAFWMIELALTFVMFATTRFAIRAASNLHVRFDGVPAVEGRATLLYGAGWAGVMMARSASRDGDSGIVPVGFLDDDPHLVGSRVAGLRVFGGLATLHDAVQATGATSLLITMPTAAGEAIRRIVEAASDQGLRVHTVPPVTDLLDGSLDASRVRKVRVEDLLRRPLAKEHTPAANETFAGRTVVITGAAGSIGSELARQVVALDPGRIALVDQAESPLYLVERELAERIRQRQSRGRGTDTVVSSHLVDITEAEATAQLFRDLQAHIVLHAAAYKHVPMLEDHPSKAIETNIGGTVSVADAAEAAGVDRFVLVSTDKAVRPSSVMGASKRVAEMLVADAARRLGRPYISVRFGNVLGSNGSVVPIFQDQLEKGEALTITDPEMTRYFMTIPEASWLILDAAAIAESDGLYVLDMGEPVRIIDIAHDLVRLSGRDPDSVPIRVTGLRKGEKMHEELFYDEETAQPTAVPKVLRAASQCPPRHLRDDVRGLMTMAATRGADELRSALHTYVRVSLQPDEGFWSVVETAGSHGQELGTRPVVIVPVHGDGQHAANGKHAGNGKGVGVRVAASNGSGSNGAHNVAFLPVRNREPAASDVTSRSA